MFPSRDARGRSIAFGGRIIDLSRQAAKELGFYNTGTARVRVRYIGPAPAARPGDDRRYARAAG